MEKDNLEILREDIRGKFDLVLEGHAMLHKDIKDTREQIDERFNVVDLKMNTPNRKIAAVAAQLSLRGAQRRSTFPPVVFARSIAPICHGESQRRRVLAQPPLSLRGAQRRSNLIK